MDVVEWMRVDPFIFYIVYFKDAVLGDTVYTCISLELLSKAMGREKVGYNSGWIGERSLPMTLHSGYCSAIECQSGLQWKIEGIIPNSMAQIPVPVPKSSACSRLASFRGARCNLP